MKKIYIIILIISAPTLLFSQKENFNVIDHWLKYSDAKNALYHYYAEEAFQFLDKRDAEVSKLSTKVDWEKRQRKIRKTLFDIVGPFPQKTPLNARITGVVKKDDYRLEKIIFESQPKFYVTAAMFIPNKLKGKAPAIIYVSGHAKDAFRTSDYQHLCINLVKKGFIVFAFDPIGQGERLQYFDSELGKSRIGIPTSEHSYSGMQCFLTGSSLARYMIWDGIRAVDYLLTRPEVDTKHIGITGRSGGGTQSAYIAAFDDRIPATAPECYITNMRRLWESVGPQDAEQSFYHGLAKGIDFADLFEVRAPKPALQITTTRDFFSIQGAIETEKEVKKVYSILNAEEKFYRVEDNAPHGVTKKNREACYAFFQKHLSLPGDSEDHEVKYLTADELQITETGQVASSIGGETVFSLNKKEAQKLVDKLNQLRKNPDKHLKNIVEAAKKITGYKTPGNVVEEAVFTGRYQRNGYVIEKYFIKGEGDYPIPFLLLLPKKITGPPIIYLNPEGKSARASVGDEIEWFVLKGHPVLSADLIGYGEMKQAYTNWTKFGSGLGYYSYTHWFSPVLIGKSIVGIHAADIQRLVLYLKQQSNFNADKIYAIARGNNCSALLHVAVFEKGFSKIALIEPLISYRSIVMNQYYHADYMLPIIPGVLTAYDLPDLAAAFAPNKLLMVDVKNQLGNNASDKVIEKDFTIIRTSFSKAKADKNFYCISMQPQENIEYIYRKWLK